MARLAPSPEHLRLCLSLAALTLGLALLLRALAFPAAELVAAILAAATLIGGRRIPRPFLILAQAAIGVMIGLGVTPDLLDFLMSARVLLIAAVAIPILLNLGLGWLLHRLGVVDRATGLVSSLPGAASAVVAVSPEFGAHPGLVAFIQYSRVIMVALLAATIAGLMTTSGAGIAALPATAAPQEMDGLLLPLLAIAALTALGIRFGRGGFPILGGMILIGGAKLAGVNGMWLPSGVTLAAFCLAGWFAGSHLDRATLRRLPRIALPILLSNVILMLLCMGIGLILSHIAGIDHVSAFLATIPGGLDTVAVVAMANGADTVLVMVLQSLRFLFVVFFGFPLLHLLLPRRPAAETPAPRSPG